MPDYLTAIEFAWGAWMASWAIAARFADKPVKRSALFFVPLVAIAAGVALVGNVLPQVHDRSLWQLPEPAGWTMFALALGGFAFAWWARLTLGRLWSGTVTLKANHRIVDTGPYGIVRHPIYAGILFAAFASVIAFGRVSALAAGAVLLAGLFVKALVEERFLARELGVEAYAAYRRRVPMLVPFGRKSA